jgi:signal transduction histidine kinase/CheY-like chemotaxis protein
MTDLFQAAFQHLFAFDERGKQVRVAASIGAVAGFMFAAFNILTEGMLLLGLIELASVVLLVIPAILLSRMVRWVNLAETMMLIAPTVIFGALIVLGGVEGTGLFWVYTAPFLAFFLKGQRVGWWFSLVFMAVVALYLMWLARLVSFSYVYSTNVAIHFLLSLGFYTMVAAAFDFVRGRREAEILKAKTAAETALQELQMAQQQTHAAYAAKSRFLSAASHDLRQPAHALGLFVARLSQLPQTPTATELVKGVTSSVRALQEMLDMFFDYSRLNALAADIHVQPVSTDILFEQLRTCFASLAAQKGLRYKVRAPSCAWVQSDPILLQRILLNLVSNAVRYTKSGTILVCCRPTQQQTHVRIEVWDSGIGIDASHHSRIFEEFFQIDNQARDRDKGLGLGLSMVERSCKLLHHPIQLRSTLGQGSRFVLTVPIASKPSILTSNEHDDLGAPIELNNLHVMVIEDDVLSNVALSSLLRSWGCQVTSTVDAVHACQAVVLAQPVHFIISDLRLPGPHNGIEAINQVRALARRDISACLVSGDTDEQGRSLASAAQLVLLKKPTQPAKLRNLLRRVVPR